MKLLINASTLSGTGVTQVAVSFISECINLLGNDYYVFLSPSVERNIDVRKFPDNFHFYKINDTAIYGIQGYWARKKMKALERSIKPDCVFSVFGPSYWTPLAPHLMGYAYPHYVYPDSPVFSKISVWSRLRIHIYKILHRYFFKRNGSYYVCETSDVSQRLEKYLSVKRENIFTVNNTCSRIFVDFVSSGKLLLPERKESEFRLLSLCTPYVHKNLTILNKVIPLLKRLYSNLNVKFVLTIDDEIFNDLFVESIRDYILNIGVVRISNCPQIYAECDAIFLPTLLECFSANYPEAMTMGKPILTSDLTFATTVCGNAALYFNPLDEEQICSQIAYLISNRNVYATLVQNGKNRFLSFNTSQKRALNYLSICKKISGK